MKKSLPLAVIASIVALTSHQAVASILYNPVVTVVGDGGTLTTTSGYTTSINVYQNSVLNAGPLETGSYNSGASGSRLVTSPADSEGVLTNNPALADAAAKGLPSTTGCVFNAGYDAADGTANVSSGTAFARSIGVTQLSLGSLSSPTVALTKPTAYSNSNFRGANGNDAATKFYGAGNSTTSGNAGWRYIDSASSVQLSVTNSVNVRTVETLGGQLFGTTGAGTHGLYAIGSGTPTTTGQTATLLINTGASSSPYEFVLIDDPNNSADTSTTFGYDTAYIADDSSASSNGGIQKWVWNGTVWSNVYTLDDGLAQGLRGLAGQLDTDTNEAVLWTTTFSGKALYQVTDTGVSSAPFTHIADAGTGLLFRGVALAPIPEPASLALLGAGASLLTLRRRRR